MEPVPERTKESLMAARFTRTPGKPWPVQDAKARFSELLEASLREGPQVVTKRGIDTAVLVPIEEWRRVRDAARPTLKELLLAEEPRAKLAIPPRRRQRRRAPAAIE